MKKSHLILLLVIVAGAVTAFARGWVTVSGPTREDHSRKVDVDITVDPDKAKQDAESVKDRAEQLKDKVAHPGDSR